MFRVRAVLDHPVELRAPVSFALADEQQLELREANADDHRWTTDEPAGEEFYSASAPGPQDIVVIVTKRRRVPRAAARALHEMAENRRPTDSAAVDEPYPRYPGTEEKHVHRDDYIGWSHVTAHDDLPRAVQNELEHGFADVWNALRRAWRVIRWRRGLLGRPLPLAPFAFEASFDGSAWVPLAIPDVEDGARWRPLQRSLKLDESAQSELSRILLEATDEPTTAHMLVEAFSSVDDAPQSALLIGIAAVETATKEFIARRCPGVERLVMTMPSPPLVKLLAEIVPQVLQNSEPSGAPVIRPERTKDGFADPVLRVLEKGVQMRNEVSHRGARVEVGRVRDVLHAVSDVLYLLEHYSGATWAAQKIRIESRRTWFGSE
jgi:hypothetical protein